MPLTGLDFSKSNRALSRFNEFLQYDLLDQMRSDRDVGILKVSDRLQRERQREAGEIDKDVAGFKSALSDKEAYLKAMLDIGQLPQYDYLVAMARLATDSNLPPQFHEQARGAAKEYAALIGPYSLALYNASRGQGDPDDAFAALKAGGIKGIEEWMKETGMNIRARQVAQTAAGEQAVQREKIAAEGEGRTAAATDKVTDRYIKWIDEAVQFLVGEGVQGEALTGDMPIYLETKTRDPLTSEHRGQALTWLNQLKAKVIREGADSLTDGNISFITKVWNTPSVQGFVTERLKKVDGGAGGAAAAPAPTARGPRGATGGLPSPETGATPAEDQAAFEAIRTTLINQKIEEFINAVYGKGTTATPEILAEAKKHATEYVDTNIMPSIRGK
jgi:hypothetical protein